jgi:hypothetical protein
MDQALRSAEDTRPCESSPDRVKNCSTAEETSTNDQAGEDSLVRFATDMPDASDEEIGAQVLFGGFAVTCWMTALSFRKVLQIKELKAGLHKE